MRIKPRRNTSCGSKSPSGALPQEVLRRGFTLVEVIIVVGMMTVLALFTVVITAGSYTRNVLESERDSVVSFLWRARARAIHNINQTGHGLFITTSSYIVFQGNSYAARSSTLDEVFPKSGGITSSGLSEIVFQPPEGSSASTGTITLTNQAKSAMIIINGEGQIDW